jgi:uncharacterized protein (DUF1697 family)
MGQRIALLRGINLGPHRRIAMPVLRETIASAGFDDVRTYVQSGNVVLASDAPPDQVERELERLIAERFGFEVGVVVRTGEELEQVIKRNPLGDVAVNPKRYQVSFLSSELDRERARTLADLATDSERFVAIGRELYAWHPDGVARSKLSAKLASPSLGVKATARNWATVTALREMAAGG